MSVVSEIALSHGHTAGQGREDGRLTLLQAVAPKALAAVMSRGGTVASSLLYYFVRMANKLFIIAMLVVGLLLPRSESRAEDMAGSYPEPREAAVLEWVNEARANPWAEAQRLGFSDDLAALREQVVEAVASQLASQWDEGLPPLEWNPELALAAKAHTEDMLARIYYSHQSPEGMGPEDRMLAAGFEPMFWGESLGAVAFVNVISADFAVKELYERLISDALNQGQEGAPLLDPVLTQAGFYLGGGRLVFDGIEYNVYVLACALALPIESMDTEGSTEGSEESVVLWGHVYQDLNANGRYDAGEGIAGAVLTISGLSLIGFSPMTGVEKYILGGREGEFLVELDSGLYDLVVAIEEQEVFRLDGFPLEYSVCVDVSVPFGAMEQ